MRNTTTHSDSAHRRLSLWVVIPIGLLLALIAIPMIAISLGNVGSRAGRVRDRATMQAMTNTAQAIKAFHLANGAYPASLNAMVPRYLGAAPIDAWGRPLNYLAPGPRGEPYLLLSDGPDGVAGTSDDMTLGGP